MGAMVTGLFITGALVPTTVVTATPASATTLDTLPVTSAQVQHVWLIILENKSFDETFTGLNSNSYLWQTLPSEGVLLENYYGTGHSSMDNYISLVSGQAPEEDTQEDCSDANVPMGSNSTIITSAMDISDGGTGTVGGATPNWNFGQVSSLLNASQPSGANAPSAPRRRPTAAPTRARLRPCSTSSIWPASAGRAMPRTWGAPSPKARRRLSTTPCPTVTTGRAALPARRRKTPSATRPS